MTHSAAEASEQVIFLTQETLLSLGIFLGGIALILFSISVGLVIVKKGTLQSARGRSTKIDHDA